MKHTFQPARLALALALLWALGLTAYAQADASSLNLDKTGSISLTLTAGDGSAVTGGEISLYQVASLYLDGGDMAYTLTEDFQDCTAVLDVEDTSLAATLAAYAAQQSIPGTAAAVETDGSVRFDGLELGLYLVAQTVGSDHYETISPFVVTLPMDSGGAWVYAEDASPKVGTITASSSPEPEEPTPSEPTLPQTG